MSGVVGLRLVRIISTDPPLNMRKKIFWAGSNVRFEVIPVIPFLTKTKGSEQASGECADFEDVPQARINTG